MNGSNKNSKLFTLALCAFLLFISLILVIHLSAREQTKPFTLQQVIDLLINDVEEDEIILQINKYKVDFELTRENTRKLLKAEASDELLDAVENNQYEAIVIISPKNGEKCGKTVKVEGKSKVFSKKHLWLFAHVKGLSVWWPQRGKIMVEKDGEWTQGVFLGGEQDIGFDFEIKAIWVNDKIHKKMEDYLAKGEDSGHYPGIRLPEGSPSAQVTLRKVKH